MSNRSASELRTGCPKPSSSCSTLAASTLRGTLILMPRAIPSTVAQANGSASDISVPSPSPGTTSRPRYSIVLPGEWRAEIMQLSLPSAVNARVRRARIAENAKVEMVVR
jgi:hypothetical protein